LNFSFQLPSFRAAFGDGAQQPGAFPYLDLTLNPDLDLHVSRTQEHKNFTGDWPCLSAFSLVPFFLLSLYTPSSSVASLRTWQNQAPRD
jgi:hypothetical protein